MKTYILILYIFLFSTYTFSQKDITSKIESKFNIKVYTKFDSFFFDKQWSKSKPIGTQIGNQDLIVLSSLVDSIFSKYPRGIISENIRYIYFLENLVISNENHSVVRWNNVLYIASKDNNVNFSKDHLIDEIINNISELLYEKFKPYFDAEKWSQLVVNDNLSEKSEQSLLYEQGILNNKFDINAKDDFIEYLNFYFSKKEKLKYLSDKYSLISKKNKILNAFISEISDDNFHNLAIENRIKTINNKFNIEIIYDYSIYNFPSLWFSKNNSVSGSQMSITSIDSTLNIIESFLEDYEKFFVNKLLFKVYLIDDMRFNGKETVTNINYNSIYVSNNFSNEKTYENIEYYYIYLFYRNFSSFFPTNKWQEISKNDSLYISENGKTNLFYDFYDYFISYKISNNNINNKKSILFQKFYSTCDSLVNLVNNCDLKKEFEKIKYLNDVDILYFSKEPNVLNDTIKKPASLLLLGEINDVQLYRYVKILNDFFAIMDKNLIKQTVQNIYLYGGIRYFNSNDIAGTYDSNTSSLFLVNIGNDDNFLLGAIVHELSSLILFNNFEEFPLDKWVKVNDSEFEYKGVSTNNGLYEVNQELNEKGFINLYSTTYWENDFNEFSKLYFLEKNKLLNLAKKYQNINKKYQILNKFYNCISTTTSN